MRPSRIIAASSAITTRMFRMLSRVRRQPDADAGRPTGRAGDVQVAVDGTDSVSESGQAGAAGRVGPADTVVGHDEQQPPAGFGPVDRDRGGVAVLTAFASSSAAQK